MQNKPVLILGAGINGAAIARELLLNDVPVLLVDSADLASGATSYSTRLVHGGLRYLEYGEVGLVRESLAERTRLLELAPDFVQPLRLYIPVNHRVRGWMQAATRFLGIPQRGSIATSRGRWLIGAGLRMYDLLAYGTTLPRHSLHRAGVGGAPAVDSQYRWLYAYYDAQMIYPERFVAALLHDALRIAAERGLQFNVLTYCRVERDGVGVTIDSQDSHHAAPVTVQPSAIVNATGSWVDDALASMKVVPARRMMGGTKGSHLVTFHPGLCKLLDGFGVYAEADDGRPVFMIPWRGGALIGTTDVPFEGDAARATAGGDEVEYLLNAVNRVLPGVGLRREDITLHYAGVRPLPFVDQSTPAAITRRHWVETHPGVLPIFSVIGGKLTVCRSLAEQTAAKVLAGLGKKPLADSRARPIRGASGDPREWADRATKQRSLAGQSGLDISQIEAIWPLCAAPADTMLSDAGAAERESLPGTNIPRQFARHVIRTEWVTRLSDVVERRLMLLYDVNLSVACLRVLAGIMKEEGVISPRGVELEVEQCRQRLLEHFGRQLADSPA